MDIDIYTRNGKLIEIHYIEKRKEFYILLDQSEPRTFKKVTTQIREFQLEKTLMEDILQEAERKFKDIRFGAMLNPEQQPEPPVLTFFEQLVTEESIISFKEKLRSQFFNTEMRLRDLLIYMREEDHGIEMAIEETKYFSDYFEVCVYIPHYSTFTNRKDAIKSTVSTKPMGKIGFHIEKVSSTKAYDEIFIHNIS